MNVWALPKESFNVLGAKVKEGRDCMTRVMWNDSAIGADGKSWSNRLHGCGGKIPQFDVMVAAGGAAKKKKKAVAPKKKTPVAAKKKKTVVKNK